MTLTSLDEAHPFSGPCTALLVNPQGCAARFGRPLEIGASVQLGGLPAGRGVTAHVVNCISLGEYEKFWILGLAVDEPGNVWGIESPPQDWNEVTQATQGNTTGGIELSHTKARKAMGKAKSLLRMFRQFPTHESF
jgi:hypothetical protein